MAAPRVGEAWSKLKKKTWEDWALGASATAGLGYVIKNQWRRGIRNIGAGGQSSGRFAWAGYRSVGDFIRANSRGNQPFAIEPYVPGALAVSLYVATPVIMLYQAIKYPHIAGPMQQSAATGQFNVGSIALDEPASSWGEFFSWDFWGVH